MRRSRHAPGRQGESRVHLLNDIALRGGLLPFCTAIAMPGWGGAERLAWRNYCWHDTEAVVWQWLLLVALFLLIWGIRVAFKS
jgi:hypothetical protein